MLIVGAGPAGLAAAATAAATGARVILVDEQNEVGGSIPGASLDSDSSAAMNQWIDSLSSTLAASENCTVLTRTTAVGYFDYNYVTAVQKVTDHLGPAGANSGKPRQRFWKIRARQVVIAAGSIERPMVFADNDRPGVMLANAVDTLSLIHI